MIKYSPEEQAIYKRHMDSGMANNRKATHDFVDLLVKLEKETGIPIDLTTTEALRKAGYGVAG